MTPALGRSTDADALLCNLIAVTRRREDFVTEVFAWLLRSDRRLARLYAGQLLGRKIDAGTSVHVITQHGHREVGCRPDMLVKAGEHRIAVEHKLDAPEGPDQIAKYLRSRSGRWEQVALVSANYCSLSGDVLGHDAYLKPRDGQDHFVWTDFWPVIAKAEHLDVPNAAAIKRLFIEVGLQPAHRFVPRLRTPDAAEALANDRAMSRLWDPLRRSLKHRQIAFQSSMRKDRTSELYLSDFPKAVLQQMWLDPFSSPSSLLIRLRTDTTARREVLYERLDKRREMLPDGALLPIQKVDRKAKYDRYAVDVRVPWAFVLGKCENRASAERSLKRLVLSVIDVAMDH